MAPFDTPIISSDEPRAFTLIMLIISTYKVVLTAILSYSSVTKKSEIMGDLLDLVQLRL
jgi:hypothetical protein